MVIILGLLLLALFLVIAREVFLFYVWIVELRKTRETFELRGRRETPRTAALKG